MRLSRGGGADGRTDAPVGARPAACFGPVDGVSEAKALYATCDTGYDTVCTSSGIIDYDTDCPVFASANGSSRFNLTFTPTPTCPDCAGDCAGSSSSASPSPTTTKRRHKKTKRPTRAAPKGRRERAG